MQNVNLVGDLVDKKFKVIAQLGEGGFGSVYLAEQLGMNRNVALKFVHISGSDDSELLARFEREGRIMAALDHKNIVRCYAYGLWRNRVPYLALEYLEGKTLLQLLQESKTLPWQTAFEYGIEICSALTHLHSNHITHRDLKPANIIILPDGTLKLIDFGLVSIDGQKLTKTGSVVGSLFYLSPEQAYGTGTTPSSDLYSLGCVLYHMIAGTPPFTSPVPIELLRLQATVQPPSLLNLVPGLPKGVERIIMHSLQKEPSKRYASAAEFADDMQALLQNETIRRAPVAVAKTSSLLFKFRAAQIRAAVVVALIIGVAGVSLYFYKNRTDRQTEAEKLSAEIGNELQKSGLTERHRTTDDILLVGVEDLLDESFHSDTLALRDRHLKIEQAQRDHQPFMHLDRAVDLASNVNVSNDDLASVLLTESHSWDYRPVSSKEALRWIDQARACLSKPIQRSLVKERLASALDDLQLRFAAMVFAAIRPTLYGVIQNPNTKPRSLSAVTRFDNLMQPILGRLNPNRDPPDVRWSDALSQYGFFLAASGRSAQAMALLQPYIDSTRVSYRNKLPIFQSLATAQLMSGDADGSLETLREAALIARKVPNLRLETYDSIILFAQRSRLQKRMQVALDAVDVGLTIPSSIVLRNNLKAEKVKLYAAKKDKVRALAQFNELDPRVLRDTRYTAADLVMPLRTYGELVSSFGDLQCYNEAAIISEKMLPLCTGNDLESSFCMCLAQIYLHQKRPGQFERALALLRRGMAVTNQPPHLQWGHCSVLLDSLIAQQRLKEATDLRQAALAVIASNPKSAQFDQYVSLADKFARVPGQVDYVFDCLNAAVRVASGPVQERLARLHLANYQAMARKLRQ